MLTETMLTNNINLQCPEQTKNSRKQHTKMRIKFNDNNEWAQIPAHLVDGVETYHDYEGVFLSIQYINDADDINLGFLLHDAAASLSNYNKLRDLYQSKYCNTGLEMIEFKIDATSNGHPCIVFLGQEKRMGEPTAYFASVTIASLGYEDETTMPTSASASASAAFVLTLWAQEDRADVGVRERYAVFDDGDPLSRAHDDLFVFHALSKLRRRLDHLPKSVEIIQR
jgi:hypothetical protein